MSTAVFPDRESLYLFNNGANFYSYMTFGAHVHEGGVHFAVWAPNAAKIKLVGDFNGWDVDAGIMKFDKDSGVWYADVANAKVGDFYKYLVVDENGKEVYKADPYAFQAEQLPGTASVVAYMGHEWQDSEWMAERATVPVYDKPVNIYEVHLGSWATNEDGSFLNYKDLAHRLVEYVKHMGYTHLELMPLSEHPLDASWGYQVSGYYAVTHRYGNPTDFKYFVDYCHQNNVGIILDWVPAHFPKDEFALADFDGTPQYEYADSRKGEHKTWGTKVFNFEKSEIVSFLISNAIFWLDEYHVDGLRIDAVSSMLYLDYDRSEGEWIANKNGGNINLEAKAFLQKLNTVVFEKYPNVIMAAEESTAFPMVTYPVSTDGLGFNYKWNMGWMHDVLDYMSMDPYFRQFNHNKLTFSMHYAFSENYILPFSHDEVVHGKRSMLDKMWGEYDDKFAQLRALMTYMFAHPGKKLNFMGAEIGQFIEWRFYEGLEWHLLEYEKHRQLNTYISTLGQFYKDNACLWEIDNSWDGFEWINADDNCANTISFIRKSKKPGDQLIIICNFGPIFRDKYIIGVNESGVYTEVLNSDSKEFGGQGRVNSRSIETNAIDRDWRSNSLTFDLPPFSAVVFRKTAELKNTKKTTDSKKTKIMPKSDKKGEAKG